MPLYRVTKYEKTEWYTDIEAASEQDAVDAALADGVWFGGYFLDEDIREVELLAEDD